jgi:hypothetical protein
LRSKSVQADKQAEDKILTPCTGLREFFFLLKFTTNLFGLLAGGAISRKRVILAKALYIPT